MNQLRNKKQYLNFTLPGTIKFAAIKKKISSLKFFLNKHNNMEVKFNVATPQRPEGIRIMDAPLVSIDIFSFIEKLKKEKKWKETDRNAITVYKTNGMRIVLIALHKGAEMLKHSAEGMISIQVLEGRLQFNTEEQTVKLGKGQMLALHEGIPHSLLAKKKTVFLLTLTTPLVENLVVEELFYQEMIF